MEAKTDEVSASIENQLDLDEEMQRGKAASEAGDKEGAYAIFKQVTAQHPEALDPWVWLGRSSPDRQEADAAFRRALEIDPASEEAARGIEWVASERGSSSAQAVEGPSGEKLTSEKLTTETLNSGPLAQDEGTGGGIHSLEDLMQLGIATAQAGDKATANVTFQSVVERYPDVPEAWVWLAGTTTNLDEAESAFQKAASLDPSNEEARLGLRWVALRRSVTGASNVSNVGTFGSVDTTNPNLKPYDSGALSERNLPARESSPPTEEPLFKQPVFILGLLVAVAIVIAFLLFVTGVI